MRWTRQLRTRPGAWWLCLNAVALCASVLSANLVVATASATVTPSRSSGLHWTKGSTLVSGAGGVNAISCASATFCVAVDRSGRASVFNGTTWTAPEQVDGTNAFSSVSCPSDNFCVATDNSGNYVEMSNGLWGTPTPFASASGPTMQAVSCSSMSFCLAVGRSATFSPSDYYFYNGVWYADPTTFSPT